MKGGTRLSQCRGNGKGIHEERHEIQGTLLVEHQSQNWVLEIQGDMGQGNGELSRDIKGGRG
jgi:hypothetical protein